MHWIEALYEPVQLILAWQPAALDGSRFRWAVAVLRPVEDGEIELRYLEPGEEFEGLNSGKTFEELRALGYSGYPAFSMGRSIHRAGVRAALLRRLPPRQRSDFGAYAAQFRLREPERLSDFALLGRTEAKVPSDGFSIVDPLDPQVDCCDLLLEIAGYRHYMDGVPQLEVGRPVQIAEEPDNEFDSNAVSTLVDGIKIGNINRLQAAAFLGWLQTHCVEATVERVNGNAERPRVFLFVTIRPADIRAAA